MLHIYPCKSSYNNPSHLILQYVLVLYGSSATGGQTPVGWLETGRVHLKESHSLVAAPRDLPG